MNWSTYDWDHPTPTNGWVASGVSLMLNFLGSDDVCFRGGGVPFVLRLPGAVKGENGPDDDEDDADGPPGAAPLLLAPSVTGDVNGVCGGTRFGPTPPVALVPPPLALCVPGSVKGAGSNGRWVAAPPPLLPVAAVVAVAAAAEE